LIKKTLFATVLLAASLQYARADRVDDIVKAHLKKSKAPAASFAVIRNGKVVKSAGYGLANVEHKVPATKKTVYQLGSITKQFTAVAVMMLVEAGKLNVDEAVSNILADLPASWSGVTVRHLLTHTSGITGYTSLPNFQSMERKDVTHAEVIKSVASLPLEFKPGEKWNYSNTGYYLLGMIIEKLSAKGYSGYLQEKIFGPLGMSSTRTNDLSAIIPNRAAGYTRRGEEVRIAPMISMSWPFSAGVLVSTVTDMAKWDAAVGTDKLLKKSSWDMVWTPVRLNDGSTHPYGFGWAVESENGHRRIEHGGGIPGFTTDMARYPDDGLTVVVLTNSDANNPGQLLKEIAQSYVPGLAPKMIADKEPEVTKLVRDMLEQTAAGTLKQDRFTPEMAAQIFPDRIKGGARLLSSQGALEKVSLVDRKEEADMRRYEYLAKYRALTLRVKMTLTKEGKIAGLLLGPE
jgi:D-alanyl-D-alanine carboxypeptidase